MLKGKWRHATYFLRFFSSGAYIRSFKHQACKRDLRAIKFCLTRLHPHGKINVSPAFYSSSSLAEYGIFANLFRYFPLTQPLASNCPPTRHQRNRRNRRYCVHATWIGAYVNHSILRYGIFTLRRGLPITRTLLISLLRSSRFLTSVL